MINTILNIIILILYIDYTGKYGGHIPLVLRNIISIILFELYQLQIFRIAFEFDIVKYYFICTFRKHSEYGYNYIIGSIYN